MDAAYTLECIINDTSVTAEVNPAQVLLDFLRMHERLTGTKEGCREGDCGACTVLAGELSGDRVVYRTVNACLLPVGDVWGMHIVTIEGLNPSSGLSLVQQAIVEEGATQCGFCTPGFVISLTGCCIAGEDETHRPHDASYEAAAEEHVDGNICRCTGHIPIKRAIRRIGAVLAAHQRRAGSPPLARLVEERVIPAYFLDIPGRLAAITQVPDADPIGADDGALVVSGGTDLYVQRPFAMPALVSRRIGRWQKQTEITEDDASLCIPGTTTIEAFRTSSVIASHFPGIGRQLLLFGSAPIRHRATIAGNLANASPIGDMTCILMALDALLVLQGTGGVRNIPLKNFYTGYKQLAKQSGELIRTIVIPKPGHVRKLSFEKVSRRRYLDIASVNSAMAFDLHEDRMEHVSISAGGVAPVMLRLEGASAIVGGGPMDSARLLHALDEAQREISPISDARGSAAYKRLLLRQLIAAHVMKYFPEAVTKEVLR